VPHTFVLSEICLAEVISEIVLYRMRTYVFAAGNLLREQLSVESNSVVSCEQRRTTELCFLEEQTKAFMPFFRHRR